MQIALIWAMARNGVIGRDGALPWRLPDEMQMFKRLTTGKPIIAGRRTFESFGKPLPRRHNIVVTRQDGYQAAGARVVHSLEEALDVARQLCRADNTDEAFVVGGSAMYAAALPRATRLYMTEIDADIDGDTYFPEFERGAFTCVQREYHAADERHAHAFTMSTLERQ